MAEALLKDYKTQLRDAGLDDVASALEKPATEKAGNSAQKSGSENAQPDQLRTGTLQTSHVEAASLPLTLPSAAPTTEPAGQYQTWRLAARYGR